jgi:hypothetical protein
MAASGDFVDQILSEFGPMMGDMMGGDLGTIDGGDVVVDLDPEEGLPVEAEETAFELNADSLNLVPDLMLHPDGNEFLSDFSDTVIDKHESDYRGSEEYRQRCTDMWRMFAGELKPKDFPWKDSANMNMPILLKNTLRIVLRVSDEIFGDWSGVFGVVAVSPEDQEVADILTQHGNWQLAQQMKDFPRQQMRGLLGFFLFGDVTFHSYYDPETKLNCHDYLTADEFCTPYTHVTVKPNYCDLPHYSKILTLYRHQIEARRGDWHDVDSVLKGTAPSWSDEPEQIWAETSAMVQGLELPEDDDSAPFKFIWFEGWVTLPGQDKERWCKAIVHAPSRAILSLMVHEQANWQDRDRFEREMLELAQYRQNQTAFQQAMGEWEQSLMLGEQATAMGLLPPMLADASAQQPPPQPPMPPRWLQNPDNPLAKPDPVRREPVYLFSHGVCIEPLVGNLGLSPGRMLYDFNIAANTALNQFTDAATLANCPPMLQLGDFEIDEEDGEIGLEPGQFLKMTGGLGDDVAKRVAPVPLRPGNPQLMELVSLMDRQGSEAMMAPDVLAGAPGKSGEPFRGFAGRLEQAVKPLSVLAGVYTRTPLTQVLENNAYLNQMFLPEQEMFAVQDDKQQASRQGITRHMYERNYKIVVRSDLRFKSQSQKVLEADEVMKIGGHPLLQANLWFQYQSLKGAMQARGLNHLVQGLGPEPPKPSTPFGLPVDPNTGQPMPPPPPGAPGQGPPPGAPGQ